MSSFKRLWALVLSGAGFCGFCGLHRFYVGKIGTGILWFLTGGLFWIGQVIDIILIAVGQFKDRYGRPVVVWHEGPDVDAVGQGARPIVEEAAGKQEDLTHDGKTKSTDSAEPEAPPATTSAAVATTTIMYEPFHPLSFLMSGVGTTFTLVAILLALVLGLQFPFLVAAGWPDADVAADLQEFFGYAGWPELVTHLGEIAIIISLLLATICTSIGRRHHGAAHLLRAVLGLAGILGAAELFSGAAYGSNFREVAEMLNSGQMGPALELALEAFDPIKAVFAGILFALSIMVLAWPPRRKQSAYVALPNQGVG